MGFGATWKCPGGETRKSLSPNPSPSLILYYYLCMTQWTSLTGHEINAAHAAEWELQGQRWKNQHHLILTGISSLVQVNPKEREPQPQFVQPKVPCNQIVWTAKDQWLEKGFFLILLEFSFLWLSYKCWSLLRKGDSGPIMTDFNKNCNKGNLRMRQPLKIFFDFSWNFLPWYIHPYGIAPTAAENTTG